MRWSSHRIISKPAAVKTDGLALEFASDDLKAEPEVVLAAVMEYGPALEFASDNLKARSEVVLAAITHFDGKRA